MRRKIRRRIIIEHIVDTDNLRNGCAAFYN